MQEYFEIHQKNKIYNIKQQKSLNTILKTEKPVFFFGEIFYGGVLHHKNTYTDKFRGGYSPALESDTREFSSLITTVRFLGFLYG